MPDNLYHHYHVARNDERRGLFQLMQQEFGCRSGIYPGCFVHITPSFYLPEMIYVDSDARAARFFRDGAAQRLVIHERIYSEAAVIAFHQMDYRQPLPIPDASVDLLISQYAGFISAACARYLRPGGLLVANNSHGDAGLARIDEQFEFIAVINRRGETFQVRTDRLDDYFVPKSSHPLPTGDALRDYLLQLGRGLGYQKTAAAYVFRKR